MLFGVVRLCFVCCVGCGCSTVFGVWVLWCVGGCLCDVCLLGVLVLFGDIVITCCLLMLFACCVVYLLCCGVFG